MTKTYAEAVMDNIKAPWIDYNHRYIHQERHHRYTVFIYVKDLTITVEKFDSEDDGQSYSRQMMVFGLTDFWIMIGKIFFQNLPLFMPDKGEIKRWERWTSQNKERVGEALKAALVEMREIINFKEGKYGN